MLKIQCIREVPNATVAGPEWIQSTSKTDLEKAEALRGMEVGLMFRLCSLCYLILQNHEANYPSQEMKTCRSHRILTETEDQRISSFWMLRADMEKKRNIRECRLGFREGQVPPSEYYLCKTNRVKSASFSKCFQQEKIQNRRETQTPLSAMSVNKVL